MRPCVVRRTGVRIITPRDFVDVVCLDTAREPTFAFECGMRRGVRDAWLCARVRFTCQRHFHCLKPLWAVGQLRVGQQGRALTQQVARHQVTGDRAVPAHGLGQILYPPQRGVSHGFGGQGGHAVALQCQSREVNSLFVTPGERGG